MSSIVMNVDFGDSVIALHNRTGRLYREDDIQRLFDQCASAGVDTVNWRLSGRGSLFRRSEVGTPKRGGYLLGSARMGEVLDRYDPPEVAVRAARKSGLRIMFWITLYDSCGLGSEDGFFYENPWLYMMSRDQQAVFPGVPCYACEEARAYRLEELRESVAYGADGLYLCFRSHTYLNHVRRRELFGFNPPVMEEYKRRHGVDPRVDEFDLSAFARIHGEGLSAFWADAAKLIREAGQEIWMGYGHSGYSGGGTNLQDELLRYSHKDATAKGEFENRIHWDWRQWVKDGLVDGMFCNAKNAYDVDWSGVDIPKYGFVSMLLNDHPSHWADSLRKMWLDAARELADSGFSGMVAHQSTDFELGSPVWNKSGPISWEAIGEAREIMDETWTS